jgi:Spy/CpxP family protein refolding chaperone
MSIAEKPSRLTSAAVGLGLTLALLLGIAGSPFAQSGPGGYGPGPGPGPGGGGMRHGGGGHQMMSPETLEGPPSPAILHDSIGLSGDQLQLYARRYSNYTAETGPVRDSLRTSIQAMRAAFESGDRSEARGRRDALERQSQELTKKDKEFEKVLKESLTKDQQKRYDKWKDARDKAEREQQQHMRRPTPGGNP